MQQQYYATTYQQTYKTNGAERKGNKKQANNKQSNISNCSTHKGKTRQLIADTSCTLSQVMLQSFAACHSKLLMNQMRRTLEQFRKEMELGRSVVARRGVS